jgi:Zn-dependent protease
MRLLVTQEIIDFFAQIALLLPAFLLAVSFHEFSHALVATLLGDDTARRSGRLTLNPLAHIDLVGLLFLLIFRIGWANPVPMDQRNFRYPRLYSVIAALAGPASNLLLAIAAYLMIKFLPLSLLSAGIAKTLVQLLSVLASINIMLGVFNLLPIPPLDGSHILVAFLIKPFPGFVAWIYRYSFFILLGLFLIPQTWELLTFLIVQTDQFIKNLIF